MNNFQLVIGLNRVSRTTDGEGFIDKVYSHFVWLRLMTDLHS